MRYDWFPSVEIRMPPSPSLPPLNIIFLLTLQNAEKIVVSDAAAAAAEAEAEKGDSGGYRAKSQ